MAKAKMPHAMHEKHLCYLNNIRFQDSNLEEYKDLVKDARFLCNNCGRVAKDAKNLCEPIKL